MQLLYATTNPGKLAEAKQALTQVELLSLTDFPQLTDMDVEETGVTFQENAFIKAKAYGDLAKVLTVGEDAGLCVDALDGRPGVYSARYAATDQERNQKLLSEMKDQENRATQFKTVICLYDPQTQKTQYFEGVVKGTIATEVRGDQGFGYDPLFIPDGYTQTFAELGSEVKNILSHRAIAIQKLNQSLIFENE